MAKLHVEQTYIILNMVCIDDVWHASVPVFDVHVQNECPGEASALALEASAQVIRQFSAQLREAWVAN